MSEEFAVNMSALCQSVTRDGKTVDVEIYEDGEGGWILEVVDADGNSTVWDDPFETDQGGLDEALQSIDDERIDALIGSRQGGSMSGHHERSADTGTGFSEPVL